MPKPLISPAPSFDEPLEMLHACHGRIEAQCATLKRLAQHVADHGGDAAARDAAQAALRYFDTAGRHHTADEEVDLFPRLLAAAGDEAPRAQSLVGALLAEHRRMDAAWAALRPALAALADGQNAALGRDECERFAELYADHIRREEDELFPLAARCLGADDLQFLGRRMAQRRTSRP